MLEIEIEQLPSFLIGEERGIKKGIKKIIQNAHYKAVAIAKQLLKLPLSITEIALITDLTLAKVEN